MQSSTLSTKVHTTKKTSFYIGMSCGVGLADSLKKSEVQEVLLPLHLGRGSSLLLHSWFASKA